MYFFVQLARVLFLLLRDTSFLKRLVSEICAGVPGPSGKSYSADPGWIYVKISKDQLLWVDTTNAKGPNGKRKALGLVLLETVDQGCTVYVYRDLSAGKMVIYSASGDVPSMVLSVLRPTSVSSEDVSVCAPLLSDRTHLLESPLFRFLLVMAWTSRKINQTSDVDVMGPGDVHLFLKRMVSFPFFQNACHNFFPRLFQMAAAESSTAQEKCMLFSTVSFLDILANADLTDFVGLMEKSKYLSNCNYFHWTLSIQMQATVNALNAHLDEVSRAFRDFKV